MTSSRLQKLFRNFRRETAPPDTPVGSDAQLMERFAAARDEDAFELLTRRHGPMVLSVCRRVLGDAHEAEDAFQATFLVLARKAASAARCRSAGAWLYTVAYRVALRARSRRVARNTREQPLDEPVPAGNPDPAGEAVTRDVRRLIDEEVSRLPEKYRVPFVLFHLEGRSCVEVARDLGCPVGTVESWLARARARLRAGLARRGLAPSLVAALLSCEGPLAQAAVPVALLRSTVRAALLVAAGRSVAAGTVSARVVFLLKAGLHDTFVSRFKTAVLVLLVVGLVGAAAIFVARRFLADNPDDPLQTAGPSPALTKDEGPGPEAPLVPQVVRVANINPDGSSNPVGLVSVNGTLFFTAEDGVHGRELWKCTLTPNGPEPALVKDITPGPWNSCLGSLTNVNGKLFFLANDRGRGGQLWTSDGTEAGTVLVKYIKPGHEGALPGSIHNLIPVGKMLFFVARHGDRVALWKSDGTEAGTVVVKHIDATPAVGTQFPRAIVNVNGTLFFVAYDFTHGAELWKSDGTEAGTVLVKDIYPGQVGSYPAFLTDVNGTLFFVAEDPTHGRELWMSDGTEAGTVLVKDITPGPGSAFPVRYHGSLTAVGKTLFFAADDGVHGEELWKSNGTAAGTVLVKDINRGVKGSRLLFGMEPMVEVNGTLYFAADDGVHGRELWKSDGTGAGTVLVKDLAPGVKDSDPSSLVNVNGTLFFAARDRIHRKLWKTDGTAGGTVPVKEFFREKAGASPDQLQFIGRLIAVNGGAFLVADWHSSGERVWDCKELWYLSMPRRPGR